MSTKPGEQPDVSQCSSSIIFYHKDEVCGVDPTVFRRYYHEEVEDFDEEDVAEPQYSDKRCDVSPHNPDLFQNFECIHFIISYFPQTHSMNFKDNVFPPILGDRL